MRVTVLSVPLTLGALALLSGLALGQAGPGDGKARGRLSACRTDLATFCQNVDAGGGRKIECLARNRDKLAPECAAVVDARKGGGVKSDAGVAPAPAPAPATDAAVPAKGAAGPAPRLGKACAGDLGTHCKDAAKGGGERIACLQKMLTQLTPGCASAVNEVVARRKALREACATDRKTLCAGQKGPESMACLRSNRERLSARCAELLSAAGPRKQADGAGGQLK